MAMPFQGAGMSEYESRVDSLFEQVLDLPQLERDAFLDCYSDTVVAEAVRRLMSKEAQVPKDFLFRTWLFGRSWDTRMRHRPVFPASYRKSARQRRQRWAGNRTSGISTITH